MSKKLDYDQQLLVMLKFDLSQPLINYPAHPITRVVGEKKLHLLPFICDLFLLSG